MSFQTKATSQLYGDQQYLTHKIIGTTPEEDRYLFAMRMAGYGIFSFGAMRGRQTKRVSLAAENILSPISLVSVYAFGTSPTNDEIRFRLFNGETEIAEQVLTRNEMPYQYPKGGIVDPSLDIEVEPRYSVTNLVMYWQPVHILKYVAVA